MTCCLRRTRLPSRLIAALSVLLLAVLASPLPGQVWYTDINPNRSTLDPTDPDGASGGRVNGLAGVRADPRTFYAASEWGGLYKSTDRGQTWFRLDRHLPTATWDVEVDPRDANRVYATSFYDGRVTSLAGINVSTDAGATWIHPASATPPPGFCAVARRTEPSAFGIGIDPEDPRNAYVGTNCGLAVTNDQGVTWTYVDPTPNDPATNVWDVVVHHGGIVDVCGDDGHLRTTDGGATWTTGVGLPSGLCSIAASPHDSTVLFVTVGRNIYESDDGGSTWTFLGTPDSRRQGRIPFVATNARARDSFDLWFGDVRLFRGACSSAPPGGGLRCPMGFTGMPGSPPPAGWSGPFTRSAGGHDDVGDILFDTQSAVDACPVLFSSDGGVYLNTRTASPGCHTPAWEQPEVTPHALWLWSLAGASQPGLHAEDLYFGNQDNGTFASTDAGAPAPTWDNRQCCDGFDFVADQVRVVWTLCCGFSIFHGGPGIPSVTGVVTSPPGGVPTFNAPDFIARYGTNRYAAATTAGVFITTDVTASPVAWAQLGAASTPPGGFCTVQAATAGSITTFYAKTGCLAGQLWKYVGTAPGGTWSRIDDNSGLTGGFGIFAAHPGDPNRLYASNLAAAGPRMVFSTDGGNTWTGDTELDTYMNGAGFFRARTQRGPTNFTGFGSYVQPSLVAFDPEDPNLMVAGGRDSGVFISVDGGLTWMLLTDPFDSGASGVPNLPRPWFAFFDHGPSDRVNIYIGTQGRGVWRIGYRPFSPAYSYAVKLACGVQPDTLSEQLVAGRYATAINVHNPGDSIVVLEKRLALTHPPGGQRPGDVTFLGRDTLRPRQAMEVDCVDVRRRARVDSALSFFKGFVVLESTGNLDVTAVYSAATLAASQLASIDVEPVPGRRLPRRPLPPPVTHSTGPLRIPQTWLADLDEGVVGGAPADADIWFEAVTATERYVSPRNGATLAIAGTTSIGRDGCAALPLGTARIPITSIPQGTYVCVLTNLGRLSQFRVNAAVGPSPGTLVIGYTTWEAVP